MQHVATRSVSRSMKGLVAIAIIAIAVGIIWYARHTSENSGATAPAITTAGSAHAQAGAAPRPIEHATKPASPEERHQLADRNAPARAARRAMPATTSPSLPARPAPTP